MPRFVDENAPTAQWARPEETPIGGVELEALRNMRASWDAETFAVRLPPRRKPQSRALPMIIAAIMSVAIALCTFMAVMALRAEPHAADPVEKQALGALPLVEEGVPIATPVNLLPQESVVQASALPTAVPLAPVAPSAPIAPIASAATAPKAAHAVPAPTVRKGKRSH